MILIIKQLTPVITSHSFTAVIFALISPNDIY